VLFTFSIEAPANTPKNNPVTKTLKLHAGVITKISILIPVGHAALARLAIYDGETQIMPWGEDQWMEGDGETITWGPDYVIPSEPAKLEARAWNEDDTYSHTFYIRVWVEARPVKPRWDIIERGAEHISSFVRRVLGE